ncbi:16S rRNA (uracil(1498)-N(3))-methyltransferase [Alcanivorax sp. JB21]|uniref:16S rRNA (uracil(1498)-N(3))-methyltransferase n=1 Tax=Alcanivorax limicola TaxID=2874102 RepID=UPI001CC12020|nr:16S rRNA (uracil(1498)-N(3))-methyltransferase [Alcanivorax limicola]MBZ2187600.1 16S rRNA (uracil(1498)-N(3))-methyltransferase [Alcanivorax limicola]
MNLLLLTPDDHLHDDLWRISDRRAQHIRQIRVLQPGDSLMAGLLDGDTGPAALEHDDGIAITLRFTPRTPPPQPLPLTLVLGLPRPKMLRRILIDATSLGVKRIVLLNSYKVDKSYWQTPELKQEQLRQKLILGLEQAGDTVLPELILARRFRPFLEDTLPSLSANSRCLIGHPGAPPLLSQAPGHEPVTLAIGPEGGWTPYESEMFLLAGFTGFSLGRRLLRVETAVPALISRIVALP